jgi:long-chain acyl-CoA synthetase
MSEWPVYDFLSQSAQKWPDKKALIDARGSLTFKELWLEVETLKELLIHQGIKAGQGLGVMARNGRGFVIGVFAGLGAGATVMPLSHQFKSYELEKLLLKAPLHAILDDQSGVSPEGSECCELGSAEETFRFSWINKEREEAFVENVEKAAFVRFTSGTTGAAKGVVLSHQAVAERTAAAKEALKFDEDEVVVWVLPMAYHFIVSIVTYLRYGVCMSVCKDLFAKSILETIRRDGGTFLYAAPMHYQMMCKDKSGVEIPTLKRAVSTSSGIGAEVSKAFEERFAVAVSQAYGIIEIGLPIINFSQDFPKSIGWAQPGFEVEIFDDHHHSLPAGTIGHLVIRGPGMFDAYMNPPRLRDEVLKEGWFFTGDLASKNETGLISVEGREKSMINVAGNKAFPEEVEEVINLYPAVTQSFVYGRAHDIMGEVVVADVVVEGEGDLAKKIRNHCRKHLSVHKVPQEINVVPSIEMTGSGKLRRGSKE